jgi:hypothetical protein
MQKEGSFTLLESAEFNTWLQEAVISRRIVTVQQHHTWSPGYSHFDGGNHFALQNSMKNSHLERGFADIAQHFSIFPDGKICTGRSLDRIPAGIKGANTGAVCIENVGNFDSGADNMTNAQQDAIVGVTAAIVKRFGIPADTEGIIYHHWFDLVTGKRTNGTGSTKTCPGTAFFNGNSPQNCKEHFIPLVASEMTANDVQHHCAGAELLAVGKVTADQLNVRSGPSSRYGVVDVLKRAILVNCYEIKNRWWRIHPFADRWVCGRYVNESH